MQAQAGLGDDAVTLSARSFRVAVAAALMLSAGGALAQPPQQRPDLHAILHIRPDQEPAWRAFQAGMTPPAGIVSELRASAERMATMTTPQRLDILGQNLQLAETIFHREADAMRHLYAALTPDQQRIFDQAMTPRSANGAPPQR